MPRGLFIASVLLSACAPDPYPATFQRAPIIGGTFDQNDPAVVALAEQNGQLVCSGTLVSPQIVVSAAHCVILSTPKYVFFGSDPQADGMYGMVDSFAAHPMFDFDTLEADISVIKLKTPAPAFAGPGLPMSTRAPVVGEDARFVGFGVTETGDYGRKFEVTVPLSIVDPTSFTYGIATCNGDSGGPAFVVEGAGEVLAGVTSYGDDACVQYGVDTRVDQYVDWVMSYFPSCAADDQCADGCPTPDPDCACQADGMCVESCPQRDPDCAILPVGAVCESDFDCGVNLCVEDVCLTPCASTLPGACAEGFECQIAMDGRDACFPEGSGGCGCQAGRRPRGVPWLIALVIAVLLAKRRGFR